MQTQAPPSHQVAVGQLRQQLTHFDVGSQPAQVVMLFADGLQLNGRLDRRSLAQADATHSLYVVRLEGADIGHRIVRLVMWHL